MVSYIDGYDAVFLPGKIHGAEHQIYIIYYNPDADNGNGCFEIEVLDAERTLELYDYANGDAEIFFTLLPDWFQGEWYYCNHSSKNFYIYEESYSDADLIMNTGCTKDSELQFIIAWAKKFLSQ